MLYGPLNNANQLAHVSGFIERLPAHADVAAGGRRQGDRGYFWEATVVTGLRQEDEAVQREIFGPVLTVQPFRDDARRWPWRTASTTPSRHPSGPGTTRGRCDSPSTSTSGASGSTRTSRSSSDMPHGGFKHSGYGKDLSNYGFEDYTRIKHVMSRIG